jgi:thymidine phosphorylase
VHLSPADDIFIRVERALDIDSEGQLVASVLSKKIAAGSTHLVLDMPVGPTAKVRGPHAADRLETLLLYTARAFGLEARVLRSDGTQPVGHGIGPSLEAHDVLAVLRRAADAPADLRARSLALAATILELGGAAPAGAGALLAASVLDDGRALRKFEAICDAQGGMRTPPVAACTRPVLAERTGRVVAIDNRRIARVAKLAGAPDDPAAGVKLHAPVGSRVERGEPLMTVYSDAPGEIEYAFEYVAADHIIQIEEGD